MRRERRLQEICLLRERKEGFVPQTSESPLWLCPVCTIVVRPFLQHPPRDGLWTESIRHVRGKQGDKWKTVYHRLVHRRHQDLPHRHKSSHRSNRKDRIKVRKDDCHLRSEPRFPRNGHTFQQGPYRENKDERIHKGSHHRFWREHIKISSHTGKERPFRNRRNKWRAHNERQGNCPQRRCQVKLLYVSKRARLDIELPIAFFCTRVSSSTEQDWLKLKRVLEYLYGTLEKTLTLGADDIRKMKTWVDASYAVHKDMKSHTGGVVSFGRSAALSKSSKQRLNVKSSTEAELVGTSGYLPYPIWSKKFLEYQGYLIEETIFYQDNQSAMRFEKNGRK